MKFSIHFNKQRFRFHFAGKGLVAIFILNAILLSAQPGPFGGFNMSFILLDQNHKPIDNENENYQIYFSYLKNGKEWVPGERDFNFDHDSKLFSYSFPSSPVGPVIQPQFTLNVIFDSDTMKIYFAQFLKGEKLYFKKGEFIMTNQYSDSRSVKTFNGSKLLNNTIYDFNTIKLNALPFYQLTDNNTFKADGNTFNLFNTIELPFGELISFGTVEYRKRDANSSVADNGLLMFKANEPENILLNYNFENIDLLLEKVISDFDFKKEPFHTYFPNGINNRDPNSLSFAVLANLQIIDDSIYIAVLNQTKNQKSIFISKDAGRKWKKIFTSTNSYLSLRVTENRELYAFTENEIFRSINLGQSWLHLPLPAELNLKIIDLASNNESLFFISKQNETFDLFKLNLKNLSCTKLLNYISNCTYNKEIRQWSAGICSHNGSLILPAMGSSFLVSKDEGESWQTVNNNCISLIKNHYQSTWYKGTESSEKQEADYPYQNNSCDEPDYFKTLFVTRDHKLMTLFYVKGSVSLAEIKFSNLKLYTFHRIPF